MLPGGGGALTRPAGAADVQDRVSSLPHRVSSLH